MPAFRKHQYSYTKHQHFKNTSTSGRYKSTAMSLDSHVDRCQHLQNKSVHIQNTGISRCYRPTATSLDNHGRQVPGFKKCQCSYTKHQHFKNTTISRHYKSNAMSLDSHARQVPALTKCQCSYKHTGISKTPALLDVTSWLLCPWKHQHFWMLPVNSNVPFDYSHGPQVPAFKKDQCFYRQHQHFPMFQVHHYVPWQSRSTGASI